MLAGEREKKGKALGGRKTAEKWSLRVLSAGRHVEQPATTDAVAEEKVMNYSRYDCTCKYRHYFVKYG